MSAPLVILSRFEPCLRRCTWPPALDIKDLIGTIAQGMKDGHAKAAEAARKAEAEQVVAKAVERTIAFR